MLKYPITYRDFDDAEQTKDFYFHLTRTELTRIEVSFGETGLADAMIAAIRNEDKKVIYEIIEMFVLSSYGVRSDDGQAFEKFEKDSDGNPIIDRPLSNRFKQTFAYDALMTKLTEDEIAASNFINSLIPKDVQEMMEKPDIKAKTAAALGIKKDVVPTSELTSPEG